METGGRLIGSLVLHCMQSVVTRITQQDYMSNAEPASKYMLILFTPIKL